MEVREVLFLLWKNKGKMLLIPIIVGVMMVLFLKALPPRYEATATFVITSKDYVSWMSDYDRVAADQEVISSAISQINSETFMMEIANRLPFETTVEKLQLNLKVDNPTSSKIINISAFSNNPKEAAQIVNALTERFPSKLKNLNPSYKAVLFEKSGIPQEPQEFNEKLVFTTIWSVAFLWTVTTFLFVEKRKIGRVKMQAQYNVLHIVSTARLNGAERIVQGICRHLNRDKFEPVIVCAGSSLAEVYEQDGYRVDIVNVLFPFPRNILRLRSIIRERNIKLIHAHDHRASLMAWLSTRFLGEIPIISHIHNTNPWLKKIHPLKFMELLMRNRYNLSIACSETVRRYFLKHNPFAKAKEILCVTNGIEIPENNSQTKDINKMELLKKELGIPKEHYIFGTVCRLDVQKGIDVLLKAFKEVKEKYEDVSLLIVGSGPLEKPLKALAAELNLGDRVIFTGYRKDVYDMFNIMDTFVSSSRWEGLPMVLMEAMARFLPVIATDVGGVKELIKPNETGALVVKEDISELYRNMVMFYENRELTGKLAVQGRELVLANHNIVKQVYRIEEIYDAVLRGETPCCKENQHS